MLSGEERAGDAIEAQLLDLHHGAGVEGTRDQGVTDSSTPRPCSGFNEGTLTCLLTSPKGSLDPDQCCPAFSVSWLWQGAWVLALGQILFFLLQNVPRVTCGTERQLPLPRPPQQQPLVEVISLSHLFHEKSLPRLADRQALL